MSKYVLTSSSHENLRALVEVIQYQTVAPTLLREEGWNTFDVRLSDEEVAEVVRFARITPHKKLSHKHLARICSAIETALVFRQLVDDGLAEETLTDEGLRGFRLTPKGEAYNAQLRRASAA